MDGDKGPTGNPGKPVRQLYLVCKNYQKNNERKKKREIVLMLFIVRFRIIPFYIFMG